MSSSTFDAMDMLQIQNLVYKYTLLIDQGDFDGMAALFADAEVTLPSGIYRRDPKSLAATFREYVRIYPDGTPRTRHVTTNLIIEPEGDAVAIANSVVTVFQQTDELPMQPIIGTRNVDRFEKIDGRWRFTARRIDMGLTGNLSAHMKLAIPDPAR